MSDFATTPLNFTAARDYLAQKVDLPTSLGSLDLSLQLPGRIRGQAFFSARVASANILQALRKEAAAIQRGDYNYAEGRLRMKDFLAAQGYGVPGVGTSGERNLKDLASTRRLDLILRQNVAMAHAVGNREVAEHPAVVEMLPCYEYSTGPNPRAEHAQYDGLVLPKSDPFWATHYPPWDFNCNCMVLDTDAPPNGKSAGFARGAPSEGHLDYGGMRQLSGNESGFEFHSAPDVAFAKPDFSTIADADLRQQVEDAWKGKATVLGLGRAPQPRQRVASVRPARAPSAPVEPATAVVGRVTDPASSVANPEVTIQRAVASPGERIPQRPPTSSNAQSTIQNSPSLPPRRVEVEQRAFSKVTKPLRAKVSYGDTVAWLESGILRVGVLAGPDNGAGLLVRTPQGPARVARDVLRHPSNFRGGPET